MCITSAYYSCLISVLQDCIKQCWIISMEENLMNNLFIQTYDLHFMDSIERYVRKMPSTMILR